MQDAIEKFDEQLENYRKEGKFNVLVPTTVLREISPFHKPVLEIVRINSNKDAGDVYEPVYGSGQFALHAVALQKLGYAAGLIWNARNCKRTDNGNDPNIVSYSAEAAIRKEDGTYMLLNAEYMLDLSAIEEELSDTYNKKADNLIKDGKVKKEGRQDYINKCVRRDLLQKRKYRLQISQTGAFDRVIRKILGLKSTYTKEELDKPFVVPRVTFQPDISDPNVRDALLKQGLEATAVLFGTPPPAPMIEHREHRETIDVTPDDEEIETPKSEDPLQVIYDLMKRKGYSESKLPKPLAEYSENAVAKFKTKLEQMPDTINEDEIPI